MEIAQRYENIVGRIHDACSRSDRDTATVRLLGASKRQDPDRVRAAYEAGLRLAGENRLQEGLERMEKLSDLTDLEWHFIGTIQSRKCKEIASHFSMVHSVDREKVVRKLDEAAAAVNKTLGVLIEVNVGQEESKSGCDPQETVKMVQLCDELPNLTPRGLMSIPPHTDDKEDSRRFHRALRELRDRAQEETGLLLPELSMGMSHDFEIAVEEGSTIVRIGTDLFGDRPSL